MFARRILAIAALMTLLSAPAFPQCPSYRLDGIPILATVTGIVGTADFDGDGRDDLLVRDAILYRFAERVPLPFTIPETMDGAAAIADMNGDGRPDIVVADKSGLTTWINREGRSFSPVKTARSSQTQIGSIAVSDFNRDGRLDVAVGCNDLPLFLGAGDGSFTAGSFWGLNPAMGTGDFDGDGNVDAAMMAPRRKLAFFLYGDGHGDQKTVTQTAGSGELQVVADFDRDGRADVVSGPGLGIIYGARPDETPRSATLDPQLTPFKTVAADLNGDGWLDLVVTDGLVLPITFQAGQEEPAEGPHRIVIFMNHGGSLVKTSSIELRTLDLAVADANGDGIPDLAVTAGTSLVTLFGRGDGTFVEPPAVGTTRGGQLAADLDGDGDDDVLLFSGTGSSAVLWNDNGEFHIVYYFEYLPLSLPIAADLDGDGIAEVIGGGLFAGNEIIVVHFARDGTFKQLAQFTTTTESMHSIAVGRFKGTTTKQIAVASSVSRIIEVFDWPSPAAPYATVDPGPESHGSQIFAADVNRDGVDDLLIYDDESISSPPYDYSGGIPRKSVMVALSTRGSFAPPELIRGPMNTFGYAVAGDFNGDGAPDIAFALNGLTILYGDGHGRFDAEQNLPMPLAFAFVLPIAADLNGDGRTDIIAGNTILLGSPYGLTPGPSYLLFLPLVSYARPAVVRMGEGLPRIFVPTPLAKSWVLTPSCARRRPIGH
jgi:hypothetical protein